MQDLGEEDRKIKCFGATATHYYIVITVGNNEGREYYKSSEKNCPCPFAGVTRSKASAVISRRQIGIILVI
jgi:hypothetical protein